MSKITDRVSALAKPIVEEEGCSLWDVEYVREAGTWYLRVFVDKEGGLSIDDCERISRRLDPLLDEEDPVPDSYVFEVGSAEAERELKRPGILRSSWAARWRSPLSALERQQELCRHPEGLCRRRCDH